LLSRPRLATAAASIATALVVAPILATVAFGADEVIVRTGDTLTSIARRHDMTIERLVALNGLRDPNRIFAGQRLRLEPAPAAPASAPAAPPSASPARTHTVRAGEHLTGIARQYGVTIAAIADANRIADPSRIYAGQRLTIPGGAAPTAASPPSSAMPASMAAMVAERDAVRRLIVEEAGRFGVPPAFALAVAWQESGWRQNVVSWAGAVGVMQLLPATGDWVGEAMLGTPVDIHDLRHNVRAGVRLLAHYLHRYDGNRDLVLAAYYQGQTAVDRHGVYAVSRPYIASIKVLEALFGG
jgi:soluble lytic murein transglycosylase-like protein